MKLAVFQMAGGGLTPSDRLNKLEEVLCKTDCDLIICPELCLSGYNLRDGFLGTAKFESKSLIERAMTMAKIASTALVLGYPELDGSILYNSAIFIGADGNVVGNHRKLAIPPGFEAEYFSAGSNVAIVEYHGIKCAMLICYDVEFPETVRALAMDGVELLIVPTALNVDWPVVAEKIIPARAFENGIYVTYANHAGSENGLEYYGHSCIVTPTGEDAARAGFNEEIIMADIDIQRVKAAQERLPYLVDLTKIKGLA